MVQLPKVNYLVKGHIFKQKLSPQVKLKRCHKHCEKDISRQRLVRPYEHVKLVPNFKPRGRCWCPCGWNFKFCKFKIKKKEIEPFDVISEKSSPKGFFWPNKKKFVIPFCRPILDIFWLTLLIIIIVDYDSLFTNIKKFIKVSQI